MLIPDLDRGQIAWVSWRRCVIGSVDALRPCRVGGQIAWTSSVNAAATCMVGGVSMASFVVAAAEVPHESVAGDDYLCSLVRS